MKVYNIIDSDLGRRYLVPAKNIQTLTTSSSDLNKTFIIIDKLGDLEGLTVACPLDKIFEYLARNQVGEI